jgi:hypothetical protein
MQTLHTSAHAVERVILFKGATKPNHGGSSPHDSTTFKGRFGPSLSRRVTLSRRYQFLMCHANLMSGIWRYVCQM